ncbi:ATP-dependent DNA helicase RecG [Thermomonospora curvata]|uniref:ATP-dependent DNA helicase RecG n=1 Tax=Thermomonospora curvata (strain ATCC 19995 / DSM 43183 / JCM 3096 / KCTC 9072 / NBRC 15933 / NCIMB 10081 / Henssen B9) TaxID=471852 RepID=D1AB33_THECD|nr:ATP-dependent DNA helicase RecG [Thermomonospora curvata]ACY98976.1 ATP-dependent DNA helicase RecG [Thermomonospora curvata DSM 43183]
MAKLDEPLRNLLGAKTAKVLASGLELHTVGDLVHHYPRRYAQRGELTDLDGLVDGEHVTVMAEVTKVQGRTIPRSPGYLLEVTVSDGHGTLKLTFFGRKGAWRAEKELSPGVRGLFSGKVTTYRPRGGGRPQRQLTHPEFRVLPEEGSAGAAAREFAEEIIPIYPATKGLESWKIEECVQIVLDQLDLGPDPMPGPILRRHGLIGLGEALRGIHKPRDWGELERARRRLKWDEAFVLQIALAQRRKAASALPAKPRPRVRGGLLDAFDAALPFTLTEGQLQVGEEIAADLSGEHPMHRLLQGDVGAGKTVVALRAMLQVVDGGGQAALLAPTEVLAQQHYRSITAMLGPLAEAGRLGGADKATRVVLLTGSQGAKARRQALLEAASGEAGIVVGTHALLQEHVQFADLGLVVVDEQHRFGVEQRDALREKAAGGRPHVLVMTATPIPRTVAMTVFGDLETSTLSQLPSGRAEIKTFVVPPERPAFLARTWERIREEVAQGRQAYIVCPRIGAQEDEEDDAPTPPPGPDEEGRRAPVAVLDLLPRLEEELLTGLRIGVLHGKLPPDDKDAVMRRFAAGEIDVLLATTVVEVGVDVPNATVMVIMDADRFGVSQLHQLRGRVGRGSLPGLCLLVTDAEPGSRARQRLDAVASTTDGFALSRLDLEQRREGDVLGAAQAGRHSSLRLLTLLKDEELIRTARTEATALVEADPDLQGHAALAAELAVMLDEERAGFLEKA